MTPECYLCPGTHCKDRQDDGEFGINGSITVMDTQTVDGKLIFENKWQVADCKGKVIWEALEAPLPKDKLVEKHPPEVYKEEELFKQVFKDDEVDITNQRS
jgi:hypothetical protein